MMRYKECSILNGYGFNKVQICFCVDVTGSMSTYITQTKRAIEKMMENFKTRTHFLDYEFSFLGYRDYSDERSTFLFRQCDFKNHHNVDEIIRFIEKTDATGGGDTPEAVLDGLYESATKLSWKPNSVKIVFHIADAPPHGKEYFSGSDSYPSGHPTNPKNISDVVREFKKRNIKYCLIDCTSEESDLLYDMECVFGQKQNFFKFKKTKLCDDLKVYDVVSKNVREIYQKEKPNIQKMIKVIARKEGALK